jgi:adenylate kinase
VAAIPLSPQLLDEMETLLASGGNIVDFHSSELFPERWFDVVLVLRADNAVLFDRLAAR